jgi:serine protease Do
MVAGRIIPYQPKIVELFPSTGIVIDDKGHVLTFLGYRWVDIHARSPRIEIIDSLGQKHAGKLIGIDQSVRVAVVQAPGRVLRKTPLCEKCEIKDGVTVVIPVLNGSRSAEFESARVLSVSSTEDQSGPEWAIQINRPLSVVGAPLFNSQNQVIGLVAEQPTREESAPAPRFDVSILTLSQMLRSAEKIIKAGGDIQTGWLGVYAASESESKAGVTISKVEKDSPAYKAGLLAGDVMVKWNEAPIRDEIKLIQMIQNTPVGSNAEIEVLRQGKPMSVTALISARKPLDPAERRSIEMQDVISLPGSQLTAPGALAQKSLGIEIIPLSPELADFLQIPYQKGLFVASVNKQTAFDQAGIAAGDVILELDGVKLGSPQTFFEQIKEHGWGSRVILRLLRRGVELSKTVQLPGLSGAPNKK